MAKSETEFKKKLREIESLKKESKKKQKEKGKLSAWERIDLLVDKGSFTEIGLFVEHDCQDFGMKDKKILSDGVITGYGLVDNRKVFVFAQDFSSHGGTLGKMHGKKIAKLLRLAIDNGCPIIGLLDSGGARIEEGIAALDEYAKIFALNVQASGMIPQFSVILGPCAGGAAYSPALSDFVFMVDKVSKMFVTGPNVIKKVTGEDVSIEDLGSAQTHGKISGVCHFILKNEQECIMQLKNLLSYLPSNYTEYPLRKSIVSQKPAAKLSAIVPEEPEKGYDIKEVINALFDTASFFEVHQEFATNAVVGFARLNGRPVGVISTQPIVKAGCLDISTSEKISRFVNFCDAFNIPVISLVDVPGYLPGLDQEQGGIIKHGAKILYAIANATVPKISLILRKAFGGAYIALAAHNLGYDMVIAWPMSKIAVMGSEEAVDILYRKHLSSKKELQKKENEYKEKYFNPYYAAKLGSVDMIINPDDSREVLINTLETLIHKRRLQNIKKHSNAPI